MNNRTSGGKIALALQGGGSHGAFAWGVVDRLLETGQPIVTICGVSSGALIGAMVSGRLTGLAYNTPWL